MAHGKRDYAAIVQETLSSTGFSQEEYAELVPTTQGTVSRWVSGNTKRITEDNKRRILEIARAHNVRYDRNAAEDPSLPLSGRIQNGQVEFLSPNHSEGVAPMVESATREMCALIVKDDSLWPLRPGSIIYYNDNRTEVGPDAIGEDCVCKLADGRVVIRTVRKGSQPGLWTLHPINGHGEPEEDQRLAWAEPIEWIHRRRRGH